MVKSLYSKLALVLFVLFCLLALSVLAATQFSTEMYQQEVIQRVNLDLASQIASQTALVREGRVNRDALKELFHMLMMVNPSIEIYLLDSRGGILAYSAPPEKVKRRSVDLGPISRLLKGEAALPVLGDDPRSAGGRKIFSVAPIRENGNFRGYVYVILGGEMYDTIVDKLKGSYIARVSTWWILASLIFAFGAGLLLFALLTGRLKRLAAEMDAYGEGLAETGSGVAPAGGERGDEIDRLQANFRRMVARIEDQIEKITTMDARRREWIANVSHDLRTPLANLQGYIETLLVKDSQVTPEERRHYLETAERHCRWLSSLVKELFELAKLDAQEARIRTEAFNIVELAADILQKFELAAGEKRIRLKIDVREDLPFVFADIALMERVLENLLENALRHTPQGGAVEIALSRQPDGVTVQVRDTGSGIQMEDLPHIFDRFHQQRRGRDVKPGGAGLGLAITKRIMDLHGRSISVDSAPGRGTAFTFDLPAAP